MKKFFAKNLIVKADWNGSSFKFVSRLFLCSKDIQIGEQAFDNKREICKICNGFGNFPVESSISDGFEECLCSRSYKIIGPISEEALWVKDGDEFDDNEVKIIYKNQYQCLCEKPNVYRTPEQASCEHMRDDYRGGDFCMRMIQVVDYVQILSSMCKHFH